MYTIDITNKDIYLVNEAFQIEFVNPSTDLGIIAYQILNIENLNASELIHKLNQLQNCQNFPFLNLIFKEHMSTLSSDVDLQKLVLFLIHEKYDLLDNDLENFSKMCLAYYEKKLLLDCLPPPQKKKNPYTRLTINKEESNKRDYENTCNFIDFFKKILIYISNEQFNLFIESFGNQNFLDDVIIQRNKLYLTKELEKQPKQEKNITI